MEAERGKIKMKEKTIDAILEIVLGDWSILEMKGSYEAIEILLDEKTTLEDNFEWISENYETKLDAKMDIARDILKALNEDINDFED